MNQRELALDILNQTIREESYSNLLMRSRLEELEPVQRAFVTNLVNGVLRNDRLLEHQFTEDISRSTSFRCRLILCMAMYERFFLNEKDYVVNNEYTELGRNKYEKSFINAILRKITKFRESDRIDVKYSMPEWICSLFEKQYGEEKTLEILKGFHQIPNVFYRLNRSAATYWDLSGHPIDVIDEELFTSKENLLKSDEYKKGMFYVQDVNSASLYRHLDLKEDDVLLDVCSAPGSKLFNCLDIIKPGNAYANDIHEKRVELIRRMAERLGFQGIHYLSEDGRKLKDVLNMKFDKVMLDAPCSGLGVIGRKPDLKFHVKPENLDELQQLQLELLNDVSPLLKENGILLYSTCTLNKKENEKNVQRFLKDNDAFRLLEEETIINGKGDCFYYAKMRRMKP